jgi:polyisoprenoid-binding protein YceI
MARIRWEIDPSHSAVEFAVKHMMLTTVRGRFKQLRGLVDVDEDALDSSYVRVEIEASSLDTGEAPRDQHLRSPDFLSVDRFPLIVFESSGIDGASFREGQHFKLTGKLSIRETSLPVTLDAAFLGEGRDPWGRMRAGFSARGELDRRDWGLRWNQALETGGILVGNSVRLEIEVELVQVEATQEQAATPAQPAL